MSDHKPIDAEVEARVAWVQIRGNAAQSGAKLPEWSELSDPTRSAITAAWYEGFIAGANWRSKTANEPAA